MAFDKAPVNDKFLAADLDYNMVKGSGSNWNQSCQESLENLVDWQDRFQLRDRPAASKHLWIVFGHTSKLGHHRLKPENRIGN